MTKFRVYECQEETVTRRWSYDVDAADADEALELVHEGSVDAVDCGASGDGSFGTSGFAVRANPGDDWAAEAEGFAAGTENMIENL